MSFAGVECYSRTVRCVEGACVCVKHHLAKAKEGQFCENTAPIAHTHRLAEVTICPQGYGDPRTIMDFHVSVCVLSARASHRTARVRTSPCSPRENVLHTRTHP